MNVDFADEEMIAYDDRRLSGVCHHRQICEIFK